MQRFNPWFLYTMAESLEAVARLEKAKTQKPGELDLSVMFDGYSRSRAVQSLGQLRTSMESCLSTATRDSIATLVRTIGQIPQNDVAKVTYRNEVEKFKEHLAGDIQDMNCFLIPDPMAFNATTLLERGERLLPEPMDAKVANHPGAFEDLRLASRCLAMKLWTAMGFHVARATEALIQAYYLQEVGPLPKKGGQRTWGSLVKDMEGNGKGDAELLQDLGFIATRYRNPYLHPEQSLDETSGPMLLAACTGAMTRLLAAIA